MRLSEVIERDMVQVRLTDAFRFVVVGASGYLARHDRGGNPRVQERTSLATSCEDVYTMATEIDPALRATLEACLGEAALVRTLEASPRLTIKPSVRADEARASTLPRISLAMAGAPATAEDAAHVPDLELRDLLGEGGMGRVHAAFQRSLSREVAIKTLREGAGAAEAAALLREARLTGGIEHPGVVPVHAIGVDDHGMPVLVMKRIEGVAWGALIHDANHPAWASRPGDRLIAHMEILMRVCQTVHFAHKSGLVHRDIKPENVMLGAFGETYLVDWGIALRVDPAGGARETNVAGTPAYMAPEMLLGGAIDERTDVFLLGATLHEALTGETRHRGANVAAVLASVLKAEPFAYDASVPAELGAICNRATARDPSERFPSAEAMRLAITEHLQHKSSVALAEDATRRRDSLAALLAEAPADAPPADLAEAYRLASESRFAYGEALRQWPENAAAHRGLAACIALVADLELRQGHIEATEALAREIHDVPPDLGAKLQRAHDERRRRAEEDTRLRALARDLDTTIGARQRKLALGAMALFFIVATTNLGYGRYPEIDPPGMLGWSIAILIAALGATAIMRRSLLVTAFNRRVIGVFLASCVMFTVNRAIGVFEHASPASISLRDNLIVAMASAATAITLIRGMWVLIVAGVAAAIVCAAAPRYALHATLATFALVPAVAYVALGRRRADR